MAEQDDELDTEPAPDEAHRVDAFRLECQRDMAAFKKLHGRAFLLLRRGGDKALNRPTRPGIRTLVQSTPPDATRELAPSQYLVFPIRKTERSIIARFYSVGQTRNNDVVVRDVTVSKFHAFFQDADDGEGFVLLDARSTNGTFVNDRRVPRQGIGDPVKVRSGDKVRFGSVELSFMSAEELCELVRAAAAIAGKRK
jgi:pSer/pThr/pTyr-binding forkhead associated (FHA) protein